MMDLLALAERCEQATGPDRELDEAILSATGWVKGASSIASSCNWYHYGDRTQLLPLRHEQPTASLDAAMTLAPSEVPIIPVLNEAIARCWNAVYPLGQNIAERDPLIRQRLPLFVCAASLRTITSQGGTR